MARAVDEGGEFGDQMGFCGRNLTSHDDVNNKLFAAKRIKIDLGPPPTTKEARFEERRRARKADGFGRRNGTTNSKK